MTFSVISALISFLSGIANAFVSFMSWLHEQQLVQSGIAEQKLLDLQGRINAAQKAMAVRQAQRDIDERNPNGVMSDDGYRRPE